MTERWPFGDLPMFHYGLILADPPWYFRNYSAKGEEKNPVAHYDCMDAASLAALPVNQLAAPDCAMLMWATATMLPEAITLLKADGFEWFDLGGISAEAPGVERFKSGLGGTDSWLVGGYV